MELSTIHLHIELKHEYLTDHQKMMLRRYGESSTGDSISRDILIPSDMPLHNLHYTIQALFGWQNSHLRCFNLPTEIFQGLTGGVVKGWAELVGILFQPPSEAEHDIFWDDDYEKGSIRKWLRRKYKGPYIYGGELEYPEAAKDDLHDLLNHFRIVEVRESFNDYMQRSRKTGDKSIKILKRAPIEELTLEELNDSVILEFGTDDLLERLLVCDLLADINESIESDNMFPVTNKLLYNYDYGDDWNIEITRIDRYTELVENGLVSVAEISIANEYVLKEHVPVCIHKDGINVLDDVGGLAGFADFLGKVYENDDKEESREYLTWAKGQGFSEKKISFRDLL